MDAVTVTAVGALVVSLGAVALNLWKALREKRYKDFRDSAEYIQAGVEARLGSVQAAERVVALYDKTLSEVRRDLDEANQRIQELEFRIDELSRSLLSKDEQIARLNVQLAQM